MSQHNLRSHLQPWDLGQRPTGGRDEQARSSVLGMQVGTQVRATGGGPPVVAAEREISAPSNVLAHDRLSPHPHPSH